MPDVDGGKSLFLAADDAGSMEMNTEQGHSASAVYRQRDGPSRFFGGNRSWANKRGKRGKCGWTAEAARLRGGWRCPVSPSFRKGSERE